MKFRINHETKLFLYGIIAPWIAATVAVAVYLLLDYNVTYERPTLIMIGLSAVLAVIEIIFIILFLAEKFFGAKIIIEKDYVKIRMLLRRRKFHFYEIADAKYSHYYDGGDNNNDSGGGLFRYVIPRDDYPSRPPRVRARLTFYLESGRTFSLNDDAYRYAAKQKLWITDPDIDPDEDVKLYQAYQCYCAACRDYVNTNRRNAEKFRSSM
ncbi:MAG: hypothetical protein IKH78_04450 [Ruminococcus sp.]|nr:hypothetical protein [Ruminococcus sp.]